MALSGAKMVPTDGPPLVWGGYDAVSDTYPTYDALADAHPTYDTSGFIGAGSMEPTP